VSIRVNSCPKFSAPIASLRFKLIVRVFVFFVCFCAFENRNYRNFLQLPAISCAYLRLLAAISPYFPLLPPISPINFFLMILQLCPSEPELSPVHRSTEAPIDRNTGPVRHPSSRGPFAPYALCVPAPGPQHDSRFTFPVSRLTFPIRVHPRRGSDKRPGFRDALHHAGFSMDFIRSLTIQISCAGKTGVIRGNGVESACDSVSWKGRSRPVRRQAAECGAGNDQAGWYNRFRP
jgi:hypothetical protein